MRMCVSFWPSLPSKPCCRTSHRIGSSLSLRRYWTAPSTIVDPCWIGRIWQASSLILEVSQMRKTPREYHLIDAFPGDWLTTAGETDRRARPARPRARPWERRGRLSRGRRRELCFAILANRIQETVGYGTSITQSMEEGHWICILIYTLKQRAASLFRFRSHFPRSSKAFSKYGTILFLIISSRQQHPKRLLTTKDISPVQQSFPVPPLPNLVLSC
jgi:hypothetical protein